jgi:hypothetical protein
LPWPSFHHRPLWSMSRRCYILINIHTYIYKFITYTSPHMHSYIRTCFLLCFSFCNCIRSAARSNPHDTWQPDPTLNCGKCFLAWLPAASCSLKSWCRSTRTGRSKCLCGGTSVRLACPRCCSDSRSLHIFLLPDLRLERLHLVQQNHESSAVMRHALNANRRLAACSDELRASRLPAHRPIG